MPFGAIFGSLFLILLAVWLTASAEQAPLLPRLCLALTSVALAAALLMRRSWARWAGVGFAVAVALLMARWIAVEPSVGPLVFVMGAVATALLLLVPATGAPAALDAPASSTVGRALLGMAALGAVGFVGSMSLFGVESGEGAGGASPEIRLASERGYDRIVWNDFGSGMEISVGEERPMVVVFVTAWCGYCKKMDRNTFKDPAVIDFFSSVVPVRVDTEDTEVRAGYRGVDLAAKFGVRGTPTTAVVGPDGTLLAQRSGYLEPRELLRWLSRAIPAANRPTAADDAIRISTP